MDESQVSTATLHEAISERDQLLAAAIRAENRVLRESLDLFDRTVDPIDAFREEGELWDGVGAAGFGASLQGCGFRSEQELTAARNACRALAMTNEFAINGHENRVSYLVGSGHRYQVTARRMRSAEFGLRNDSNPQSEIRNRQSAAQAILDEFIRDNAWHRRQQEIVRRRDRDGEAFLRFFLDAEGNTRVRFVEPWQVTAGGKGSKECRGGRVDNAFPPPHSPASLTSSTSSSSPCPFGLHTADGDVETVLGYWLDDGEYVAAAEMQHRKAHVDANVPRGVPLFYPVRRNLARAEKLLRNMAAVSDIQTAIALIRKHRAGTRTSLEQLRSSLASATTAGERGRTTHWQPFQPGTILDIAGDAEYDFPTRGLDASRYVLVLQAILRAVASRLVMPEFMLTSDASNANYSSTLVAEGPAVKMFERLQHDLIVDDLEVMWRVLRGAVAAGRLDRDTLDVIDIQVEPPRVAVRDRLQEAQVDEILIRNGAMSIDRLAMRHGLDPEVERELRRQAKERTVR